jgi:ABC-type antimicrobial peptide transport system permease subunit
MLEEVKEKTLRQESLLATLVGALSLLAVMLACIGVYGLMAFAVARRTRDIGVRMALGARASDVGLAVLREAVWLGVLGATIGVLTALALGRLIESQLYGVTARDPMILVTSTVLLLIATGIASCWPAWRAARVDPVISLRT